MEQEDQAATLPMTYRGRNWVFTWNNYNDSNLEYLAGIECKYLGFGKEIGASLTPHLQGVIIFNEAKSKRSVIKILKGARIDKMRGTFARAVEYCEKDGDFAERGIRPMTQAQKGGAEQERWDLAREAAKEGRFDDIPSDIYMRYRSVCKAVFMENHKAEMIDGPLEHEWWYGEPGTGKTMKAVTDNPGAFMKDPITRWWDGYAFQDVVIIDDFDKYQVSQGGDIKRWLDRYVFPAAIKGGYLDIRPRKIIVTSNYHPDEIWEDETTRKAIRRRVKITKFGQTPFDVPRQWADNYIPHSPYNA